MMISPILFFLFCFTVDLSTGDDVANHGRQKYEQLRSLSLSKTSPCWQQILTMLHEHCSIEQLNKYQGFIAYQFTLCHLSTMNEDFDSLTSCSEENIDQCIGQLHQHMNAFIAYTEFYPFVQSVCYVLREKSYQSELASRLTLFLNHSQETIHKLISSIHIQQKLTHQIHHQQSVQETILNNARQLKQLARINMDKTQDILTNVIEAARHEYDLLKQICALSQTIQTIVRITCTYSFWFYALSMFAVYLITIPKRTSQARSILFCGMFIYVLVERYCQMSTMISFYQWRSTCWIVCLIIVVRFAWKYQSRAEVHHEQLSRITETLIQTEVNFSRISRELKRARSKSRSRSRSMRSRRQRQAEERALSPLVTSPQRPLTMRDENKENLPKVPKSQLIDDEEDEEISSVANRSKKPQYSLLLNRKSNHQFRSSKSTRVLVGRNNLENNF